MSFTKDGGPAFPAIDASYDFDERGMSLRDWFAGQALLTIDVQAHVARPAAEHIARSAYNIADAMLAERAKSEGR